MYGFYYDVSHPEGRLIVIEISKWKRMKIFFIINGVQNDYTKMEPNSLVNF